MRLVPPTHTTSLICAGLSRLAVRTPRHSSIERSTKPLIMPSSCSRLRLNGRLSSRVPDIRPSIVPSADACSVSRFARYFTGIRN